MMECETGHAAAYYPTVGEGAVHAPVSAVAAGDYLFLSQICPPSECGGRTVVGIRAQTASVLHALETTLRQAGCSLESLVQLTVTLSDMRSMAAVEEVCRRSLPAPGPACVWRCAPLPGALVAMDAIALREGVRE